MLSLEEIGTLSDLMGAPEAQDHLSILAYTSYSIGGKIYIKNPLSIAHFISFPFCNERKYKLSP